MAKAFKVFTAKDALNYHHDSKVVVWDGSFVFVKYNYAIPFEEIRNRKDILEWIHHLSGKAWITQEMIGEFIEKCCAHLGIEIY